MIESYQIARMRKGGEKQTLRGFEQIHLSVSNLTSKNIYIKLLGNGRNKFREDEVKVVNRTPFYDDDNNLTLLKNYINSVGYIDVVLFRLQSNVDKQVTQELTITNLDKKNNEYHENICTLNYLSPHQFNHNILDIPKNIKFKNETILSFNLLPESVYNIMMFCGKNKGDVEVKVKSFYDEMQDNITDCQHFVPSMEKGKKRILMLKK